MAKPCNRTMKVCVQEAGHISGNGTSELGNCEMFVIFKIPHNGGHPHRSKMFLNVEDKGIRWLTGIGQASLIPKEEVEYWVRRIKEDETALIRQ